MMHGSFVTIVWKNNNDWISFVNCKGHDFNLGLNNIEFHC